MVKFVLIMFICSSVPGNECKLMSTPVDQFDTYHECAIYGYEYSTQLLKNFNSDFVDQYQAFTAFDCKKSSTI